jgi:SNF2 family DNA or RNA helicase
MTLHISHDHEAVIAPFDPHFLQLFPHGVRLNWGGKDVYAMRHGDEETRMLRNLGLPVPAPIMEYYDFPSADGKRPFGKQILTAASMTLYPSSFVLNGMGTGKTKACLWSFDYLRKTKRAKRMLVVAPVSTLEFTWAREAFQTFPGMKVVILYGTADKRKKLLAQEADIYVINHDGVKVVFNELMARPDIDVICFDEAAAYRNSRAARSKIAQKLCRGRKYIWGMTGSPTPSAPTDAFGLARLVTPLTAPSSFTHFRQEVMLQVDRFKWVPKKNSATTVAELLRPSVRFTLDEIVELPPVIVRDIQVPLGKEQRAIYKDMFEKASTALKEGTITAVNGGVKYSKLLQASIGWVYGDDDRKVIHLDNEARLEALLDIVEGAENKVIIFSPFKSATSGVSAMLKREKIDYAEVTGDTPQGERAKIFAQFQNGERLRVLNAHPECMSHGLTLTAADTVVWFGPVTKLETYEQANARITRIGQTRKQQIIRFISTPAERIAYQRLSMRQSLQDNILGILAELTANGAD